MKYDLLLKICREKEYSKTKKSTRGPRNIIKDDLADIIRHNTIRILLFDKRHLRLKILSGSKHLKTCTHKNRIQFNAVLSGGNNNS